MYDYVVSWDYAHEPADNTTETWVQSRDSVKVAGGAPNVAAWSAAQRAMYRHSADGRLWKFVGAVITLPEPDVDEGP